MSRTSRAGAAPRFLAPLLAALFLSSCAGAKDRSYATHAEAAAAGEARSGSLPSWVPAGATALRLAGDPEGEHFLRFDLPAEEAATLKAGLLRVPDAQVATLPLFSPRGAEWWFPALSALSPGTPGAVAAEVFSGTGAPVGQRTWLAFDTGSATVWVWARGG